MNDVVAIRPSPGVVRLATGFGVAGVEGACSRVGESTAGLSGYQLDRTAAGMCMLAWQVSEHHVACCSGQTWITCI